MKCFLLCLAIVPAAAARADHNAVLPRPREVRYQSGTLAVQGLSIQIASTPGEDDQFAAEQLATRLSGVAQTKIEIVKGKAAGKAIQTLQRVEQPDNVINLMDALRQSLKGKAAGVAGPAKAARPTAPESRRAARNATQSRPRARKAS